MFWMGELYHHICVLDNSFCCYVEIPSKIGNKGYCNKSGKKKGGRLDEGGYYKNEVFLEIFEMLNQ